MERDGFGLSRIGQIALVVHDLERSTAFYRERLGMRFLFQVDGKMSFFDCDGTWLMLGLPEGGDEHDHPGSILYFDVEDIAAAHDTLAGRGVEFIAPPRMIADLEREELWLAFFKDAEWNVLALRSVVAKAEAESA